MPVARLLLLLGLCVSLWGQNFTVVNPESVGLDPARLARIAERIEADFADGKIAGASGLIARRGKVGYFEARGKAGLAKNIPVEPDTLFRIYSMTKPITGAALMMLREEGKFFLTDPGSLEEVLA